MDDYEKKFAEMQKYIPFLEAMIERLQKVTDKSREVQLLKMQQLHGILSDSKRKLRIETLQKCEDVLQKLHNKVEKGTSAGMNFPNNKKSSESTLSKNICVKTTDNKMKISKKIEMESSKFEETPASPSPPQSPDERLEAIASPIIIPTERKHDYLCDKSGSKPASPDQSETVCTKKPIIIPTERTDGSSNYSSENLSSISSSSQGNDYDFHDHLNATNVTSHKRHIPTISVSPRTRRISSSIEKLGSSSAVLDKESECLKLDSLKQSALTSPECRSPRLKEHIPSPLKHPNVPASLLVSPPRVPTEPPLSVEDLAELLNDGSNLNSETKDETIQEIKSLNISKPLKSTKLGNKSSSELKKCNKKDNDNTANKNNDDDNDDGDDDDDNDNDNDNDTTVVAAAAAAAAAAIAVTTSTTTITTTDIFTAATNDGDNDNDNKAFENSTCRAFVLTQEDIDREIDRRWETIDKPIIKFRRKLLNDGKPRLIPQRHNPQEQLSLINCKKSIDDRDSPMSPVGNDRGSEPRYADNYERIPRIQKPDPHNNNSDLAPRHSTMPDMSVINSAFSRLSEGDKANLVKLQTNLPILHTKSENFPLTDDRELYQRRGKTGQMKLSSARMGAEQDYGRDNSEYYIQRSRPHSSNREYSNQRITGGGYSNAHSNNQYEHNTHLQINQNSFPHTQNSLRHSDMWNIGANTGPGCGLSMERSDHHMSPQTGTNENRCRPLMSPTGRSDINHGSYIEANFSEEVSYSPQLPPLIPPLMSSGLFNPPHRGYLPENRSSFEPSFERPGEFVPPTPIRPTQWESATLTRNGDINYHDNLRGRGTEVSFNSPIPPTAPPLWNRGHIGEMQPIRDRSKERFPLDRKSSAHSDSQYSGFNRRSDWDRASLQNENNKKFTRETRNISERDPRFRKNPSPQALNLSPSTAITKRDPRLSKEPVKTSTESKSKVTPTPLTFNNRDPRRRISDSKDHTKIINTTKPSRSKVKSITLTKTKETLKSTNVKSRRSSEDNKTSSDKLLKDTEKMQSPLESLYGVIDTAAKTGKGYGLQKFRIPKIKRPDRISQASSTPPKVPSTAQEFENPVEFINEQVQVNIRHEEKKMEVTSTTDETPSVSPDSKLFDQNKNEQEVSEAVSMTSSNQALEKNDHQRDISEAIVDTSTPGKLNDMQSTITPMENQDGPLPSFKDEITREWIEKMIKNSLELGEGKKLLEQAKLLKKLGEGLAHSKKFKKIRKIIESQSGSSSSDTEEIVVKKKFLKKKKRLIVSESSDDNNEAHSDNHPDDDNNNDDGDDDDNDDDDDDDDDNDKKNDDLVERNVGENDSPDKQGVELKSKGTSEKSDEENSRKDSKIVEIEHDETQKVELPIQKPRRKPAKRRNSLEMLQEDIREMFISEGVVTATGHRMCRLMKKTEGNLASVDDKVKGRIYASSSPDRYNETGSEEGEGLSRRRNRSTRKNCKSREHREINSEAKSRGRKTRKRPIKVSKQLLSSSDSEEDGCTKIINKRGSSSHNENVEHCKDSKGLDKSKSVTRNESENILTLRRSERVSMREPRVMIEKTDLGRIDSSKIMFDTSSDESFGIDVSELTAAVDISLHSDRQKRSQVEVEADTNVNVEEENGAEEKKKIMELKNYNKQQIAMARRSISKEDKILDIIPCQLIDDTTCMALDDAPVSSSSNNNEDSSVKKVTNNPTQLNKNEELIENIIGDFVNDNNDDGNVKNDENIGELTLNKADNIENNKEIVERKKIVTKKQLPLVKRKKKRNTWQMGILSKSKKKTRKKKMTRSMNATNSMMSSVPNKIPLNNFLNDSEKSSKDIIQEQNTVVNKLEKDDNNHEIEEEAEAEKDFSEEILSSNYQQIIFNTEKLIDYAWKGQEKYPCLLCNFNGKNIVHHYKTVHPKNEIMISRLTLLDAKRAIDESKDEAFLKLSEKVNNGPNRKYTCRFCVFTAEGEKMSAMETFYEHSTTHTGEYRFKCKSCNYQTTVKSSMRAHYYKVCRKNYENFTLAVIEEPIPNQDLIYGYLCSICNFIQLKEDNVKKHIENFHKNDNSVSEIIRINMSSYFDVKENVNHSESDDEIQADDVIGNDSDASSALESNGYFGDVDNDKNRKTTKSVVNKERISNNYKIENTTMMEQGGLLPIKSELPHNDGENLLKKRKLSAFVCPPELENEEVEIRRERQKTMQELLKNYGTKFRNTCSEKGPSIIDKLKDKMTINQLDGPRTVLDIESSEDIDEPQNEKLSSSVDGTEIEQRANDDEECPKSISQNCEHISLAISNVGTVENIKYSDVEMAITDEKSDKKPKDPLMSLEEETRKDLNSAEETSDGDVQHLNRSYAESDTSDDISDCELSTDVNKLLKETINTTTNAPMMTTIQRLAAQLQGSKGVISTPEISKNKMDSLSKPIVVPISDLRSFVEKQKLLDNKSPEYPDTENDRSNTPKNFIRLRRLSGDKLSSGKLKTEILIAPKENETEDHKSLKILENKGEEDCSFLKIENVISLAPNASLECESPLINDIRKAVATSPIKNIGVSVLKKSSPNILKKIRTPIGKIDGILSRFQAIAPNPNSAKFILQPISKPVTTLTATITTTTTTATTTTPGTSTTAIVAATITTITTPPPPSKSILTTVTKPIISNPQKTIVTTSKSAVGVSKSMVQSKKIIAKPLISSSKISTGQQHGKNYKILKVFRPVSTSKMKDVSTNVVAQKEKTLEALTTMLQAAKLRHLYKCMERTCTYTTDSGEAFGQHFEAHVQKSLKDKKNSSDGKTECGQHGFKKCAYCYVSLHTWEELNLHYKKKHSFCAYQCGYCFYRGFTQSYVDLHQNSSHQGKPASVILGIRDQHPVEIIDRRENVHPFVCKHECNKLFYVPEAFIAHLKMKHGATLSIFKCHMCPASALKAETLISHYKMHGIYKYQCLYCLFGADAPMELHHHLSFMHCNRPPKILERSLPVSPVRDKDVLLQLIIRNLDDTFKCSELKNITEIPSVTDGIIIKKPNRDINIITADPVRSPEVQNKKTIINRQSMMSVEQAEIIDLLDEQTPSINNKNLSNSINIEESTKIVPISTKNLNGNGENRTMLKLPDGAIIEKKQISSSITKINYFQSDNSDLANEQLVHEEPELVLRYANERVKIQIANAVDPLRIPDNLNMNDEFVNINVLDNPEFLKTAEQRASDKFNEKAKSPSCSEDKNNDSDIEIIECIESSTTKHKKPFTPIKESLRPFLVLKEEIEGRKLCEKIDESNICTSNENSNTCIESSGSTEVSAPSAQTCKNDDNVVDNNADDNDDDDDDDDDDDGDNDNDNDNDDDDDHNHNDDVDNNHNDDDGDDDDEVDDNIAAAANNNKDNEITDRPPLTLEDIKHTGFAGKDLYKCANEPCTFKAMTPSVLKGHINECSYTNVQNGNLKCIHCAKRFVKTGNLIDHLKIHGLKRFGCSLCNMRYALACQAVAHMKAKHKIASHKLIPADPTNPSPDALFIVQPLSPGEKKGKKFTKHKSFNLNNIKVKAYGPNEIGNLPRQAIYNREVRCAVCPYTTKVRTNIIRHLQLHAKDETVPELGPVNPVPCLDKKEKMFDKMVNLASSSHQNGRMSVKLKETGADPEDDLLPKFIPEKQRYVCCIADCNCLTINEDLLRCHIKALHPEESFFRCPHCPPPGQDTQSISIDKLGVHLKMHDTRLYKCSHCNHHHYHRHVVERHLTDKHPEKRPFVKVIREIENTEIFEKAQTEEPEPETLADPDGNHWKCNVCDYKCVYKTEMVAHASSIHEERAQFKCTVCPYKTSGKINFEQHIISKHINEPEADYTMVYERIKGIKKAPESMTEATVIDEPFDTTPLWRRDMPRIRHIRGILLEEEHEKKKVTAESPAKSGKRKSDTEPSPKPAKIKPKSIPLDVISGIVEKGKTNTDTSSKTSEKLLTNTELEKKFGPYGRPSGNMYRCTICSTYMSKYRQDIRDHLYMELKYWRWHCKDCGHLAVSHSRMLKHENKSHKDKKPITVELEAKEEVEKWVLNLMNTQRAIMRGEIQDSINLSPIKSKISSVPLRISPPTITLEDSGFRIIPSSSFNETANEISKTVDLTSAITKFSTNNNYEDDEDEDDNALIIDSKELDESTKELLIEEPEGTSTKDGENKMYSCKHCNVEFAGLRGFKIHVQINHLKRLAFICPYCDRSTNSETMMRQHIRGKHQGKPETILKNPSANGPELTNEFWEKEYGIVIPKKNKKRKRKLENTSANVAVVDDDEKLELTDICVKCGFTAINSTGLKAHMRAHAKKHSLKCGHCSFTANSQTDIWQHSEINHPELDWRAEPINSQNPSKDQSAQYEKKEFLEDYHEDIEEETTPMSSEESRKKVIYTCFYCKSVRSISLSTIRSHWSQYHKNFNEKSVYKTGVPFKFTESLASILDSPKLMKCGYCPKKGSNVSLRTHNAKKHQNLPFRIVEAFDTTQDIWICKWCNERVEGGMKKTSHHNMFHSHLPIRFKREQEAMVKQKGYICPECPFISVTLSRMRTHIAKHVDVFQCKRCLKTFSTLQAATQHTISDHSGLAAAIERLPTSIELMMAKVSQSDMTYIPEEEPQVMPSNDIFRNLGVARKSTTKQLIRKPSTSSRAVARKSTNPLPRYPPGFIFDINELPDIQPINQTEPLGWSYYGRPSTPVDYDNLNTVMVLGAAKMRVKCTKLAKLMNIDARVVLVDFQKVKTV